MERIGMSFSCFGLLLGTSVVVVVFSIVVVVVASLPIPVFPRVSTLVATPSSSLAAIASSEPGVVASWSNKDWGLEHWVSWLILVVTDVCVAHPNELLSKGVWVKA